MQYVIKILLINNKIVNYKFFVLIQKIIKMNNLMSLALEHKSENIFTFISVIINIEFENNLRIE